MTWIGFGALLLAGTVLAAIVWNVAQRRAVAAGARDLAASEERFREMIENVPYATIVARRDGIMQFANSAAVELF